MDRRAVADIAGSVGKVAVNIARERVLPVRLGADPGVVPPSAKAVTPQWLTAVLGAGTPGAAVLDVSLGAGDAGTSARRALQVVWNSVGQSAGLPTALFTKATSTFTSRLLLGVSGVVEAESVFYNAIRPGLDLRSPRAYYAGYDPSSYRSLVLLEDLSAQGWSFPAPMTNPVTRADAEDMVEQFAVFHAALWDSPRFGTDLRGLRTTVAWQEGLNRISFAKRCLVGLRRAGDVVPADLHRRGAELQSGLMESLNLQRRSAPTLLHQDVHLGNWLRDPAGRMGLYDWQCVATGLYAQDLSYALAVALPIEDRRAWEKDLLALYLDHLRSRGVTDAPDLDAAWTAYRQQILHALTLALFSIGGSRFENQLQPLGYMLWAIERLAQFAVDHETLDALR